MSLLSSETIKDVKLEEQQRAFARVNTLRIEAVLHSADQLSFN